MVEEEEEDVEDDEKEHDSPGEGSFAVATLLGLNRMFELLRGGNFAGNDFRRSPSDISLKFPCSRWNMTLFNNFWAFSTSRKSMSRPMIKRGSKIFAISIVNWPSLHPTSKHNFLRRYSPCFYIYMYSKAQLKKKANESAYISMKFMCSTRYILSRTFSNFIISFIVSPWASTIFEFHRKIT